MSETRPGFPREIRLGTLVGVAASVTLAACGISQKARGENESVTSATETQEVQTNPQLYFDDLRPGRHFVAVYPGVRNTRRDRQESGEFLSGDKVDAVCKIDDGRLERSNPHKGERRRSSRQWFKILTTDGPAYASAVYTRNLKSLRAQLKDKNCKTKP